MAIACFNQELKTGTAPLRMFKALILDSHSLIPKIAPQGIKSIEIDTVDAEKLVCKYTLIMSDSAFNKIESVVYEVKFEASSDDGCICKMTSKYHVKAGVELKEEDIKHGKDKATGLYKVVEEYLAANPDAYA
ncbi:major strawberry allergen Fra a 1.06-like [Punica granatum]|uniref:Major strawberry allergen Fra a 1.06-like n=1 Tax=Punica granatum TaxID=22663 RepID=A0A6P8DVF8_PUNGR|nr:major strawberry allergen Fra a 1.06-like [Punica granatum]